MSKVFVRFKRTQPATAAILHAQKMATQLSVITASRKAPRLLKLRPEDLIRHQTVTKAWSLFQAEERAEQEAQLRNQYQSTLDAVELLQKISPRLYKSVTTPDNNITVFPRGGLRTPTEYPPTIVWRYQIKPN
ncbi:hypothetical protein TBLA_0C01960 [Henningerozyma blattae CBS 6284]|uniref:Large ribosomal subunit protein mL40 n=1 Tax=Henningerozyma blattae (strain ATCC 34711 / CBS 6284 / DSM 70876 / NBRC 10599 / NRRL Y-10934 / UCD 77-7) TaxID=1071380 RepID=I2H0V7_HENB6|nr:hypothetical protein TBLA_0C01960 [Tetrapisispora blattae CBS 6284]CCH60009.1 hypothetical protein TBLA_0C01960 [Tetrapisispora blattae CBS 6284]